MTFETAGLRSCFRRDRPAGTDVAVAAGAAGTAVLASVFAVATPLGPGSAMVATATYAMVAAFVLATVGGIQPFPSFGCPNTVTLMRAVVTALVAGYAAECLAGFVPRVDLALAFAGLAGAALAADGLDGWLARRHGPATAFGARFDMEVDALMLLVLSVLAFGLGKAGAWVLAIGLMRYGFVAAGRLWPTLNGPLPPSYRRKLVCVVQGVALVAIALPFVSPGVAAPLAAVALVSLASSFAIDVVYLLRRGAA